MFWLSDDPAWKIEWACTMTPGDSLTPGSLRELMHDMNGQIFIVRGNAELIEMTTQDAATKEKSLKLIAACDRLANLAKKAQAIIRAEKA